MDQSHDNELSKSISEGITMVDVLKEEEELENDAAAVLGAGDDSSCTYDNGYMTRQAIYACQTCLPADKEVCSGICLGCSYHCHEGHDLVELYTKRNFRCDCGNSKYPENNSCKYVKDKLPENPENSYNQNYLGKYCSCNRPYPDPEDHTEDQMIQCIICEDWYHGKHLETDVLPAEDEFSEMICGKCFTKFEFLQNYINLSVTTASIADTSSTADTSTADTSTADTSSTSIDIMTEDKKVPLENVQNMSNHSKTSDKINETNQDCCSKTEEKCKLVGLKKSTYSCGAVFFGTDWRKQLCTCKCCKELYSKFKCVYLIDPEDTVSDYESKGRAKLQSERGAQRELDALSTLDRNTRIEVVHEYNNLSSSLREYLKKFADNGKVVRDEDIKEFFSQLKANKKQKKDPGMQFFCK